MVYNSFSRMVTFFSFIFCMGQLYSADQKKNGIDDSLKNVALGLGARYIDDSDTLASLLCVNRGMHILLFALHTERSNELKNSIKDAHHGIDQTKVAYTSSGVRAYYVGKGEENIGNPALISISHYGNEIKKEIKTSFSNRSFNECKLAEKYKVFVFGGACYMYDTYTTQEDKAGIFVRAPHNKNDVEYVYAYCKLGKVYAPTGWLAGFLPKLHDELINSGMCTYYPWYNCTKSGLKKLKKAYTYIHEGGSKDTDTGIIVFDCSALSAITQKDKDMLYWLTPEVQESLNSDGLVGACPIENNSAYSPHSSALIHMHMSWGKPERAARLLRSWWKPVSYTIGHYGRLTISAFTEEIIFKPYATRLKKIKKQVHGLFSAQQKPITVLQPGDKRCTHALAHLQKHNAFVSKNWAENSKKLTEELLMFRSSRYTFTHNERVLLIHDTVRLGLYIIKRMRNGIPTLQLIPNVKENDYHLNSSGYSVAYQPDQNKSDV